MQVLSYDLLVGADGAGSIVRRAMAEVLPPGFCQQRVGDARYAMMALEHAADGEQTHSVFERHEFMVRGAACTGIRPVWWARPPSALHGEVCGG